MACENGQLAQCLDEGLRLKAAEEEVAIKHALNIGKLELAQQLVPQIEAYLTMFLAARALK